MTGENNLDSRSLGSEAERFAAEYLKRRRYRIVDANVRYRVGEIDLVCEDGATLVFVEVRARRASVFGTAAESVGRQKQRRVYRAVEAYLADRRIDRDRNIRIDVVTVRLGPTGRPIDAELIQNAFGEVS